MRAVLHLACVVTLALFLLTTCQSTAYRAADAPICEVPFTRVQLTDAFWAPRIETNRTVSIPSALHECEVNGRFDNFAIAGHLMKGEHRGDFSFDDTDPYKIIEGASYSLAVKYDEALDQYLDSVIHIIASAQEPDGYLTTCVTNQCRRLSGWWGSHRWEKINSHELYNSGHMMEAAVAHYRATGKRTLLDVAIRNADLVCTVFGPDSGQIHRPSGHPIAEMALSKLYKVTGEERYLRTAKYFVDEAGRGTDGHRLSQYSQDHKPILEQDEIVGHAVRAGYLFSGVADVAALTGDTAYFHALTRIWDNMAGRKLYITGGIGSRAQGEGFGPDYELHNHTAYCETCAAIANVYWNHRMFLATGDAKYEDVLERALYNGVIAGVSLSGDKFFYDNPLQSMGEHGRERWFGCACCPGNITRFMASVPNYMYATRGDDVYVNLYIAGVADVETEGGQVRLTQETQYPWDGHIRIAVTPDAEREFSLLVRIPGWAADKPVPTDLYTFTDKASKYTVRVNGHRVTARAEQGYVAISRAWRDGDVVEIDLPMEVRRVKAHDEVVDDRGKLAIERGPVMYCLEGVDQADSTVFDRFIPDGTPMTATYEPDLLGGVVTLSGMAGRVDREGRVEQVPFTAIPYATWNNRGPGEMAVWIAASKEYARPTPEPTIASRAHTQMRQAAIQKDAPDEAATMVEAWGVNDQWEPTSSADTSTPYHYWWLKVGSEETLAYAFDQPYEVSHVEVYWLDFDHYDGDFRVPESWSLSYRDDSGHWLPVEAKGSYGVEKDRYNTVDFTPVTTTGLMITAQLQQGASGGVIEWKVE